MFNNLGAPRAWSRGLALLACLCVSWPWPVAADQDCPPTGAVRGLVPTLEAATNPNPRADDIELPLPGGGKLVLKHVCVPASGFLGDTRADLGCNDCQRPDMGFMEGKHREAIAGSLSLEDLPVSWQTSIKACLEKGDGRCPRLSDRTAKGFYYFIGKYEITRYQYEAVLAATTEGAAKPAPALSPDSARPMTSVTWFQALDFTQKYTQWLLKNHPQSLPKLQGGRTAFLRLPTEAEWEYAARGGHMAGEMQLSQEDMFPLQDKPLGAYAVYTDPSAAKPPEKMAWIGSRCPNPLGLYDTAGNAAEMIGEPFRFSVGHRLHGSVGGFVAKGGSYRKDKSEILPGRREEMPYFLADGPYWSSDLGFRVVLAGIVTPENRRVQLAKEWAQLGEHPDTGAVTQTQARALEMDQSKNPLSEIDRLIKSASNEVEKKNLGYLRTVIKENNIRIDQERAQTLKGVVRTAVFTADAIINYALRNYLLRNQIKDLEEELRKPKTGTVRGEDLDKLTALKESFQANTKLINDLVIFYLDRIGESLEYPPDMLESQIMRVDDELRAEDHYRQRMIRRLNSYKEHLALRRAKPTLLTKTKVLDDIIPDNLR